MVERRAEGRARLKGLPVGTKPPYGYQYRFEDRGHKCQPASLKPSAKYPVAVTIWRQALSGVPIRRICHELAAAGIASPWGGKAWYPGTIHTILKNPAYAGRLCALRTYAREPGQRRNPEYGK